MLEVYQDPKAGPIVKGPSHTVVTNWEEETIRVAAVCAVSWGVGLSACVAERIARAVPFCSSPNSSIAGSSAAADDSCGWCTHAQISRPCDLCHTPHHYGHTHLVT